LLDGINKMQIDANKQLSTIAVLYAVPKLPSHKDHSVTASFASRDLSSIDIEDELAQDDIDDDIGPIMSQELAPADILKSKCY
jgi:hypothetical protein